MYKDIWIDALTSWGTVCDPGTHGLLGSSSLAGSLKTMTLSGKNALLSNWQLYGSVKSECMTAMSQYVVTTQVSCQLVGKEDLVTHHEMTLSGGSLFP